MGKNLYISALLDVYGDFLGEKPKAFLEYYYNDDLSLSEIAENEGITRQGVRDSIKRGESVLLEMEERLGLAKRFHTVQNALQKIVRCAQDISYYNDEFGYSPKIAEKVNEIIRLAKELDE